MTRAPAEVGSAANSYEILAKLAMGGMAEIFLARGASSAGVERYVVLKRVLRHKAGDVHFVQMFLDEARLAAQLQHPNIAQVYDIGKLGDSYFFTMEYVHGETVRTLLARSHGLRRQIPISAVLSIIAGAAAGLQHAHDRKGFDGRHLGIVHRDVSPSNLIVSYEGTVKVVDFGVAKAAHQSHETMSGTVKGKISYMSPEQCKGLSEIDRRCDLFSLGIVMWELLTTEKLFRRSSDFETMQCIVSEEVVPPSQLRPDVPPEIDYIVKRLLAKEPAQRYQTADELHEAIENVAVRTGSALSTASLGRYMRELFGQRPEPWIELAVQDQNPEVFTVTSEPIPNNLALSPAEDFDRKLSAVPALTQRITAQTEGARPPQPTIPLRIGADLVTTLPLGADPAELMRTQLRESQSRIRNVVELPVERRNQGSIPPPLTANAPVQAMFTPEGGMPVQRPHSPSVTPQSSPHYPIASSASHQVFTGMPPSYPIASRQQQAKPAPKRSRALIIIAPAVVIGIVIGIVLGFGGGKEDPPAAQTDQTMPPAGTTTMVATPEPDKPPVPADKPAADEPAADKPAADKPAADKPAAATETSATSPPTAPSPVPTVPPDEPIAMPEDEVKSVDMTKPAPKPKESKDRKTEPKPDIAALFKADDFSTVVSVCSNASSRVLAANAPSCTIAACKAKQAAKAKKWFAQVGAAKKSDVLKSCDGVLAADKPAQGSELCKTDPMACQH
ncbi:MAG TPA: protein kinase [Kofleriaceae bacterium]